MNNYYQQSKISLQVIEFVFFSLAPEKTLFAGIIEDSSEAEAHNMTLSDETLRGDLPCDCKLSTTKKGQTQLNEISANRFFKAGSLDRTVECSASECRDLRGQEILERIIEASKLEDLDPPSLSTLDIDTSDAQVATVKVIGGPLLPRPQDGWTDSAADAFCEDFIRADPIVTKCRDLPGVDIKTSLSNCRTDVQVR